MKGFKGGPRGWFRVLSRPRVVHLLEGTLGLLCTLGRWWLKIRPVFDLKHIISKVSPEPAHKPGNTARTAVHHEWCVLHSRAVCIARHSQLYICTDAGCTAVRVDPSGVYICMEGVIPPVQLYGLSGTVCTCVRME